MSGIRSDTVTDEYNRPVPGASIYVFNADGTTANVYSDAGLTILLAQPLPTDQFGGYTYYAADGYYVEETWFGGKRRSKDRGIGVGSAANTLQTSVNAAALSAAEAASADADAKAQATNAAASAAEADTAKAAAQLALALGKGDPGGNAMAVGTFTSLTGMTIAVGQDSIETTGYAARGDGGRARYVYDPAIDATYVTAYPGASVVTANGRGYRLDERRPHVQQFTGGGNTGFLNAKSWADFKNLKMPFLYYVTDALAPGSWSLPAGFNDQLGVGNVVYDGTNWYFQNNPISFLDCTRIPLSYTTYYLSYASGNDTNNGTSSGTPFKTWIKICAAVGALAAGSNVLVVILDQNVGYLSSFGATNGFSGRNVKVVSQHASGFTRFLSMREDKNQASFGWVAHGTHGAWKAPAANFTGSGFTLNMPAQFWLGRTDRDGFPIPITSAPDATTVDTTPLTWFQDGSYFYLHLPDGAEPDPFNNWIYSNGTQFQINTDSGDLVFSTIRFFTGAAVGAQANAFRARSTTDAAPNSAARIGFDGCYFYGSSCNGLGTFDIAVVVARNCKAAYCYNDLFNTHSFNLNAAKGSGITYYEENCSGHHAGYTGFNFGALAQGTSNNCSTGHDGMSAVIVGSQYHDVFHGSPIAYVGGADVACYGVKPPRADGAGNSATGAYNGAFTYEANTGEGARRRMTLVGCTAPYDPAGPTAAAAAIQIAGTATDAVIYVDKWQGDAHARLDAHLVNLGGNASGSIVSLSDNTLLFKAA